MKSVKVGLIGYDDIPTGLGQLAARLWRGLPLVNRLVVRHPKFSGGSPDRLNIVTVDTSWDERRLHNWLEHLDVLLYCERPYLDAILPVAKKAGVKTVCIPMPEWLPPDLKWLPLTDKFIAFTDQCYQHCVKIGVGDRAVRLQCPLPLDEFPFRERQKIERVVYCDGTGGKYERKGLPVIEKLLAKHPGAITAKSLRHGTGTATPANLYADADLVVVPGRFDGLGLTLLEAMASGCVVVATDCPPYSEFLGNAYGPLVWAAAVGPKSSTQVRIWSHEWPAYDLDEDSLWYAIDRMKRSGDAAVFSNAGHDYIVNEHGESAWQKLWEVLCE